MGGPGRGRRQAPVVLVTDYGTEDTYAGSLVGAVWRVDPRLRCVTGTHAVPPGDALAGAYHVKAVAQSFGRGSVVCGVVDPEVGTGRRCIAVEAAGTICVAPDNGLVTYLWDEADPADRRAVELPDSETAAPTFAGRDLLAPCAARLAAGTPLEECGIPIDHPRILRDALSERQDNRVVGRVAVVDHFGNVITTVRASDLEGARAAAASWAGGRVEGLVRTYAEIAGELGLLVGSAGHLEIAARGARAVDLGAPSAHEILSIELVDLRMGGLVNS